MLLILLLITGVLFIILLILSLRTRKQIENEFLKLEEKVDQVKETHVREMKELLRKHEEDIAFIKSSPGKTGK